VAHWHARERQAGGRGDEEDYDYVIKRALLEERCWVEQGPESEGTEARARASTHLRIEASLRRIAISSASIHAPFSRHSKTRAGVTSMSRSNGSNDVTSSNEYTSSPNVVAAAHAPAQPIKGSPEPQRRAVGCARHRDGGAEECCVRG